MIYHFAMLIGADILLKATVILLVAAFATRLTWWTSAAIRHAIWSLALLALVSLPILEAGLPSWRLDSLVGPATIATPAAPAPATAAPINVVVPAHAQVPAQTMPAPASESPSESLLFGGLFVWIAGAILMLGRLAIHKARVSGITSRATPADPHVDEKAKHIARELGCRDSIRVLVSDEITIPASWGDLRPVVLLPANVDSWTASRLQAVLVHEVAHIVRHDYAIHLISEISRSIYWVNPLVWVAARRSAVERERACDDVAVRSGLQRDVYATRLVEMARLHLSSGPPAGALAMATRSGLAERVRGILSRSTDRSPVGTVRLVVIMILTALVAIPVASLQVVHDRSPTMEELLDDLMSSDANVARHAAWYLGEREDRMAVPALIDELHGAHPDVRLVAAWALGEIKDPGAIDALATLLDSGDPFLREMATLSLGEIEHPDAVPMLVSAVDQDPTLGTAAIWALGEIDDEGAVHARHAVRVKVDVPVGAHLQVWTGGYAVERDVTVSRDVDELIGQLTSSSARERRAAAQRLGVFGAYEAVDPLLDMLRDPEPSVRAMAVWALDEINPSRH